MSIKLDQQKSDMVGSLNKVILIGEMDGDIEIKDNALGKRVVKFFLRTLSSWTDKDGFARESIERHRIVIFNERFVNVMSSVKSGAKLYIEGAVQHSKWQDSSGQDHYTVEIVLSQFRGTVEILARDDINFSMTSINRVFLIGNLGKDPEIRSSGRKQESESSSYDNKPKRRIASLVLATSDRYRSPNGEYKEKTEWHDIVIFNDYLAGVAEKYMQKGMKVYVDGYLRSKVKNAEDGVEHRGFEVIVSVAGDMTMLSRSRNGDDASGDGGFGGRDGASRSNSFSKSNSGTSDIDDDIPF